MLVYILGQLHSSIVTLFFFRYGWLADATLRYPMQTSKPGCQDRIGIIESPTPQDKSTTFNAWCYKIEEDMGREERLKTEI